MISSLRFLSLVLVSFCAAGCLDPMVSDELGGALLVLPAGSEVPNAHDDPAIDKQIADFDGVDELVPLIGAFAGGAVTHYWDFGSTPEFAIPLFRLIRKDAEGNVELIDHLPIIDAIPGDAGYSAFWAIFFVEVTDAYDGEVIPSFAAVEEAQRLGILKAPDAPTFSINCPVVARGVTLEVGGGNPPIEHNGIFFWQGQTVEYFDFGVMPLVNGTAAPEERIYVLRREGEEPLSEPLRGVDITGDGDIGDSNNIFSAVRSDPDYSPLARIVNVALDKNYSSIDTSQDESDAEITRSVQIFNPEPVPGVVVAYESTESLRNCPQQVAVGGF